MSNAVRIIQRGDIGTGAVAIVVIETREAGLLPEMCTATADATTKTIARVDITVGGIIGCWRRGRRDWCLHACE